MAGYVERRDAALDAMQGSLAAGRRQTAAGNYGFAAGLLREAASYLDRAAGEQECIDLAAEARASERTDERA